MDFNNNMPLTHAIGQPLQRAFKRSLRDRSVRPLIKANRARHRRTIPDDTDFINETKTGLQEQYGNSEHPVDYIGREVLQTPDNE